MAVDDSHVTAGTAPGNFRGVNPIGTFQSLHKAVRSYQLLSVPCPAATVLDSASYAADFNEVLALGATISSMRSAYQLESARFHTEAPPNLLTRNYRAFAMDSRSLAENARGMAMLWVAQTDALNTCFESK